MKNEPTLEESIQHFGEIHASFNVPDGDVLIAVYNMDDKLERLLTTSIANWSMFSSLKKEDPMTKFQYILITNDIKDIKDTEVKYSWLPPVDHETEITTDTETKEK